MIEKYETAVRNKIRKKIFESMKKGVLIEQEETESLESIIGTSEERSEINKAAGVEKGEKPKLVLDEEATAAAKNEVLNAAAEFDKGPDLITATRATAIAKHIYNATKGGLGIGTDEAAIKKALSACPTLMDVSLVSATFEKMYKGALTFNPNLAAVFSSELDQADFMEYVEAPLRDKPFVSIGGRPMTRKTFEDFVNNSAKVAQTVGRNNENIDLRDYASYAAAGAGVGLLTYTAANTGVAVAKLGSSAYLMAGGLGVAKVAGVVSSQTAIGLLTTPVGLSLIAAAALGVGAYMLFNGADIDKQMRAALSSEAYTKMSVLFRDIAADLRSKVGTIKIMVEPKAKEPDVKPEDPQAQKQFPPLSFTGLASPIIKNIQIAMNEYCITRNISQERIAEDGQMGPETRGRWHKSSVRSDRFAEHAIDNHSIWKTLPEFQGITESDLEGRRSWQNVSRKIVGIYPGYTPNEKGMLAFCIDAYYDNDNYGKVNRGKERSGRSGRRRGSGAPAVVPGTPQAQQPQPGSGGFGPNDVTIRVGGLESKGVNNLTKLFGPGVKTQVARHLISRIKNTDEGQVVGSTSTLNVNVGLSNEKVSSVSKGSGQFGDFRFWKQGTFRGNNGTLLELLKDFDPIPAAIVGEKSFTLNIRFKAGTYDASK